MTGGSAHASRSAFEHVVRYYRGNRDFAASALSFVELGITAATWIAAVAGIGFTVALFITELAFHSGDAALLTDEAKIGVLVGSVAAALIGAAIVATTAPRRRSDA
ncbi:Na+/H+ antiporter NhaA [Glycomyces terrestris]|uniref:Uncharacterized protein n=1 Tax=Glycomyces terrestris TaxID=2493553 RepID=A0A426V3J8_9ACTN|nr:Na+/H+ antiporter NhaA [Glycomyces terrestris]RRS01411.1 hypothetical protein EIW28_01150 [Glycomyces terrestris]